MLARTLLDVSWRHVQLSEAGIKFGRPGTRLGIDGVAKGWIIDSIFHHLRDRGLTRLVVNIGDDLRTAGLHEDGGQRRFRISDPYDASRAACFIRIRDRAVATSGNYPRFKIVGGRRRGHILDPRTGRPPEFDGSVTVITRDTAMADALATAMFVIGPDAGLELARRTDGLDAVLVSHRGIESTIATRTRWPAVQTKVGIEDCGSHRRRPN